MDDFTVKKRNRNFEALDFDKLEKSLKKCGVKPKLCREVISEVEPQIDDRTTSSEIFRLTKRSLEKKSKILAANYHLVRGIYELGPTGYPFEVLCSEMLKKKGFKTQVGVVMKGRFVKHEVDVLAIRDDVKVLCECKFHNKNSGKSNVKVPLYINSRFLDILGHHGQDSFHNYVIFSNTTFSKDAIKYAEGVGINLIAMNYPKKNTIVDHIIRYKIYPITCLKTLRKKEINFLLDKGVVVIKQLKNNFSLLEELDLTNKELNNIRQEINLLLKP